MGGVCPRKDVGEGSVPGRPQRALPDYNLMRTAHLPLSMLEDGGWQKNTALILHPVLQMEYAPAPNSYIEALTTTPLPLQCGCIWRSARIGVFVRRQQRA